MDTSQLNLQGTLKKIKYLKKEVAQTQQLIAVNCADYENENPTYKTVEAQTTQISRWVQSVKDMVQEIENLSVRLAYTNLTTKVKISFDGNKTFVEKTIAAWVLRKRELSAMQGNTYNMFNDKNLRDKEVKNSAGQTEAVHVRRYYDVADRDAMKQFFRLEPSLIDTALETTNNRVELKELPVD